MGEIVPSQLEAYRTTMASGGGRNVKGEPGSVLSLDNISKFILQKQLWTIKREESGSLVIEESTSSIRGSRQDLISIIQLMPTWATPDATAFITPRGLASALPVPPTLQHLYPDYALPGPTLAVMGIIELNPSLLPPSHPSSVPSLSWNMLFPPPQGIGADPATWPPVQILRLVSQRFTWNITVVATNIESGVTCNDVIQSIHKSMHENLSDPELKSANTQTRTFEAWRYNRSVASDVPQGDDKLPDTYLKCDFLGRYIKFGGIVQDKRYVKTVCALSDVPGTFELQCIKVPAQVALYQEDEAGDCCTIC
ncbi:hypothetical protein NLI96_g12191 [Meripilus lineatus]|uniref:DUF6699 domain-containing protein n=1 Tax=Meripilus lineatus TaxID=2056292 RepID=A0AAD5UQC4_9APHY|nr:hypothetical protein NLI96_g12191 [Physisporinus lineatus]